MNDTVLVTGAAGMVGSHLVDRLAQEQPGRRVLASYHRPTIRLDELLDGGSVVRLELDIRHSEPVRRLLFAERPSVIYHLAAQSLPTVSWVNPWDTLEVNVLGTVNLFESIKSLRASDPTYDPVVVVACSSAAYGASLRPELVPIPEDVPLMPMHPYGVSKAGQDMLTYQYWVNDRIRGIRARIFNSTGPRKTRDVVSDFAARVAALHAAGGGVLRTGNLETQRAILDVQDLVDALLRLAERGHSGEAYNICATAAVRVAELIPLFERAAGIQIVTEPDPALFRPSDEPIIFGDTTRLREHTGWHQRVSLAETVARVTAYEITALQAARRAAGAAN